MPLCFGPSPVLLGLKTIFDYFTSKQMNPRVATYTYHVRLELEKKSTCRF